MRFLAVISLCVVLFAGCINADTVDGPVEMLSYDIVTFAGNDPTARFLLYGSDSDSPAELQAAEAAATTSAKAGDRVLIAYSSGDQPGFIDLRGMWAINSGGLHGAPGIPGGWDRDSVWIVAMWQSGQYVDVRLRLPYSNEPRTFALTLDSASLATPVAQLYLDHRLPHGVEADATFSRMYYASFDIGRLWHTPGVEAAAVNVANANIPSLKTFTFKNPITK